MADPTSREDSPRSAILTGAGGGLARATALRLARRGDNLTLTDIDETALKETAAEVAALGPEPIAIAGDVRDPELARALADAAMTAHGRIDALCNAAGVGMSKPFESTTVADFERLMGINCTSQLLMMQAVLPAMREARSGSIVNISSVGARVPLPNVAAYAASKAAIIGLTRCVALDYAEYDIRCNVVCPGAADTGLGNAVVDGVAASFPTREAAIEKLMGRQLFKRFATPDEIAGMLAYLLGPDSTFVTGSVIDIDGGHTSS